MAIVSLTFGIGASTAIFSVVQAILLRPLPYREPARVVIVAGARLADSVSGPNLRDVRERSPDLVGLSAYLSGLQLGLDYGEANDTVTSAYVEPNLFSTLGASMELGRWPNSDTAALSEIVVSAGLWRSHFGASRSILGTHVRVEGQPYTIVGVTNREFFFPDRSVQMWLSFASDSRDFNTRSLPIARAIARMAPNASLDRIQAELSMLSHSLKRTYPSDNRDLSLRAFSLREALLGEYRRPLWMLFGGVSGIFFISCANVAVLLVARGVRRESEFAVRATFGASPVRLLWHLLLESVPLAASGAVAGVLLAKAVAHLIANGRFADVPRIDEVSVNGSVVTFAVAASILAIVLANASGVMRTSRVDLVPALRGSNAGVVMRSSYRQWDALVIIEIAISLVLLAAALLFVTSFVRLARLDWGIEPKNVLSVIVRPSGSLSRDDAGQKDDDTRSLEAIVQTPGVESAAVASGGPGAKYWTWWPTRLAVRGEFRTLGWAAEGWIISQDFFKVLGIPAAQGRLYSREDDVIGTRTVVIAEPLAKRLWPAGQGVGQTLQILRPVAAVREQAARMGPMLPGTVVSDPKSWEPDGPPWEVIGVVRNIRMFGAEFASGPALFLNYRQLAPRSMSFHHFLIKTQNDPAALAGRIRATITRIDSRFKIVDAKSVRELVALSTGARGSNGMLVAIYVASGALGLGLAICGLYAVMTYSIRMRRQEFALRLAFGATPGQLVWAVTRRGSLISVIGCLIGTGAAFALARLLPGVTPGVDIRDAFVPLYALVPLQSVAIACCYLSARSLALMHPADILRST